MGRVIGWISGVLVALTLILTICSASKIGPREEGVEVKFGKVQSQTVDPGLHFLDVFSTVEKLDTSIQTLKFDSKDKKAKDDVPVRLKLQTTGTVPVTVRWRISATTDADLIQLYKDNKTSKGGVFDNIEKNVVEANVIKCTQNSFSNYDPLAFIQASTGDADVPSAMKVNQDSIFQCLKEADTKGIEFISVLVQLPDYDEQTDKAINDYAKALAQYRIAIQQKLTNDAIAAANNALAANSSTNDPGVKYANCLALIQKLAEQDQLKNAPQTFNCNMVNGDVIVGVK